MTAFYNFGNNSLSQTVSYGLHNSGLFTKKRSKKNK